MHVLGMDMLVFLFFLDLNEISLTYGHCSHFIRFRVIVKLIYCTNCICKRRFKRLLNARIPSFHTTSRANTHPTSLLPISDDTL